MGGGTQADVSPPEDFQEGERDGGQDGSNPLVEGVVPDPASRWHKGASTQTTSLQPGRKTTWGVTTGSQVFYKMLSDPRCMNKQGNASELLSEGNAGK